MLRLPTGGTKKTKLDDEILVLIIPTNMFDRNETEQKQEAREKYDEPTEQEFIPYLPELYALADQVDENEADIPDLNAFIEVLSVDTECRQAIASAGNRTQL